MGKATLDGTTEQQKLFAYAYFNNGGNATQAAVEAGYSPKTATQTASRLLTYVNVKTLINSLQEVVKERAIVTKEQIAKELYNVGFSDLRKLFDENGKLLNPKEIPDDIASALGSIEVDQLWAMGIDGKEQVGETKKVKMWDKLRALSQLTDLYGFNAPAKIAATDPFGNAVKPVPLTDSQFSELLHQINVNSDPG